MIGLEGAGFENTVQETVGGPLAGRDGSRACWINPHAPVGFHATPISVEEVVRVTGAIVESLRGEIATAVVADTDRYDIELEPSAAHAREPFGDRPERVWGARELLEQTRGPVAIGLDEGSIELVGFELEHEPSHQLIEPPHEPRLVRVEAALAPADAPLEIEQPRCFAME